LVLVVIEVIALISAVILGVIWYQNPSGNYEPLLVLATLTFFATEIARRVWRKGCKLQPQKLAEFVEEGQQLKGRLNENPLPVFEHNEWVDRMNNYFEENGGNEYKVRLSDFSGMRFYGDGSEKSSMSNSIEGRVRRLHEFMSELSKK